MTSNINTLEQSTTNDDEAIEYSKVFGIVIVTIIAIIIIVKFIISLIITRDIKLEITTQLETIGNYTLEINAFTYITHSIGIKNTTGIFIQIKNNNTNKITKLLSAVKYQDQDEISSILKNIYEKHKIVNKTGTTMNQLLTMDSKEQKDEFKSKIKVIEIARKILMSEFHLFKKENENSIKASSIEILIFQALTQSKLINKSTLEEQKLIKYVTDLKTH